MNLKELLSQTPDMVVSANVVVTADVKFHRLLRVEGIVEGKVIAPPEACLVLCPGGHFKGQLTGLGLVYVNGTVDGDICVYRLSLGPNAVIRGNITCQQIEMSGTAKIQGNLNISPTVQIQNDYDEESTKELIHDQL